MAISSRLMSADELLQSKLDHCELIAGELVTMAPAGDDHGRVAADLETAVLLFLEHHRIRYTRRISETGYVLRRNPDTVRCADVSFILAPRAPMPKNSGFIIGAPDLLAEVRSPSDSLSELLGKANDWLQAGARLVWIIDPSKRTAHIFEAGHQTRILDEHGSLDAGGLIPGFSLPLLELFDPA